MKRKQPSQDFVNWCRAPVESPESVRKIDSKTFYEKHGRLATKANRNWAYDATREFEKAVNDALENGEQISITVNSEIRDDIVFTSPSKDFVQYITSMNLDNYLIGKITICNAVVKTLFSVSHESSNLILKECDVGTLILRSCNSVIVKDTQVGMLDLLKLGENRTCYEFSISGGCILDIACQPPWIHSPFDGYVSIGDDVFLPRNSTDFLIKNAQPYRNFRAHLRKLENVSGDGLIHAAELAISREQETKFNKLLSWLYECLSDYGTSTLRPVGLFLGLLAISFILYFLFNAAVPAYESGHEAYGAWRSVLVDDGICGRLSRALFLSLQESVNPLGLLGVRALVLPKDGFVIWAGVHGIFSIILIALFILAVRRKFRMRQ